MAHAMMSGMIRTMIDGNYIKDSRIFTGLPSHILEYVSNYFKYRDECQRHPNRLVKFIIPPDVAVDVLLAANFLDC